MNAEYHFDQEDERMRAMIEETLRENKHVLFNPDGSMVISTSGGNVLHTLSPEEVGRLIEFIRTYPPNNAFHRNEDDDNETVENMARSAMGTAVWIDNVMLFMRNRPTDFMALTRSSTVNNSGKSITTHDVIAAYYEAFRNAPAAPRLVRVRGEGPVEEPAPLTYSGLATPVAAPAPAPVAAEAAPVAEATVPVERELFPEENQ